MRYLQYLLIVGACFSLRAQPGTWTLLANERQICRINKLTLVRYGANNSWKYIIADSDIPCGNGTFGGDPAPGMAKQCWGGDTSNPHPYVGWTHHKLGSIVYSLYKPKDHASGQKFPLVVHLHPVGDRGNEHLNIAHGDMGIVSSDTNQAKYPCFIYAPQCPTTDFWVVPKNQSDWRMYDYANTDNPTTAWKDAMRGMDSLINALPIDKQRIYVWGGSMGGYATWYTLMKYPTTFAAAVPVAGGGDTTKVAPYAQVPIWAFHGPSDNIVLEEGSVSMIRALRRAGGNPKYTRVAVDLSKYPYEYHAGHLYVIPFVVYDSLMPWVFSQRRSATSTMPHTAVRHTLSARSSVRLHVSARGELNRLVVSHPERKRTYDIRGQVIGKR